MPEINYVVNVKIKVKASSVDEAAEIFAKATGAQILENCDKYSINGSLRDLQRVHESKHKASAA